MNLLSIPHPNLDPVILPLWGPFAVRWYGFSYFLGFLVGYFLLRRLAREKWLPVGEERVSDLLFALVLGVVLGGRLGYILFYKPMQYLRDPAQIFHLEGGGMSFHGGMIGVVLALLWFARAHKIPFPRMADAAALAATPGLFFGRLANFINKELWGRPTDVPWAVDFADPGAPPIIRHPSQIYEALTEGLLLFLVLWWLRRRCDTPGILAGVFLIGYGFFRFLVEFTREPDAHLGLSFGFSRGQYLCVAMIAVGVLVTARLRKRAGSSTTAP